MSRDGAFKRARNWWRRRTYPEGETISRFIAKDVRRDVQVISTARLDEGLISGRVRTMNVLYRSKGLVAEPDYGPVEEIAVSTLWEWSGNPWGGLPDGTSLVARPKDKE